MLTLSLISQSLTFPFYCLPFCPDTNLIVLCFPVPEGTYLETFLSTSIAFDTSNPHHWDDFSQEVLLFCTELHPSSPVGAGRRPSGLGDSQMEHGTLGPQCFPRSLPYSSESYFCTSCHCSFQSRETGWTDSEDFMSCCSMKDLRDCSESSNNHPPALSLYRDTQRHWQKTCSKWSITNLLALYQSEMAQS